LPPWVICMRDDNSSGNHVAKSAPPVCFETSRAASVLDKLFVLIVVSMVLIIVVLMSAAATFGGMALPVLPGCLAVCSVTFLTTWICWKWALTRLRFCVIFHADSLHVGRGPAHTTFPYEEVEIISLALVRAQGSRIKIKCGRRTAKVYLSGHDLQDCFLLLRQYCSNAIAIDSSGREHLPTNPTDHDKTFAALEFTYKRRIFICLLMGLLSAGWCIVYVRRLVLGWNGKMQLDGADITHAIEGVIVFGILAPAAVLGTFKSWRTLANIRLGRAAVLASRGSTNAIDDLRA
jgi:hypothetical protein